MNLESQLDDYWERLKPSLIGYTFPHAQARAKFAIGYWLGSRKLDFRMREVRVICDITNNPPSEQAANKLTVTVWAHLPDGPWRKDYRVEP